MGASQKLGGPHHKDYSMDLCKRGIYPRAIRLMFMVQGLRFWGLGLGV